MSWKTTLVLVVLVGAGAAVWQIGPQLPPWLNPVPPPPPRVDAGTLAILSDQLRADQLRRVEVLGREGQRLLELRRDEGWAWTLPGGWPSREGEVADLIRQLTSLRSRFAPLPLPDDAKEQQRALKDDYGLAPPAFTVKIYTGSTAYQLAFGEGRDEHSAFYRPTFMRLAEGDQWKPEVVRLGPGLVALLDRPQDYYQKRRLFQTRREARESGATEKVERLAAERLEVRTTTGSPFTLTQSADRGWHLTAPVLDRTSTPAQNSLLEAVGELWAERFVPSSAADALAAVGASFHAPAGLAGPLTGLGWTSATMSRDWLLTRAGLKKPERVLLVRQQDGVTKTLLIGAVSATRPRPLPPGAPPGAPPGSEEYRFAQIEGNEQIFEIRASRLNDIFVGLEQIQSAQLAQFRPDDVQRLELSHLGSKLVLARDAQKRWRVESAAPAGKEAPLAEENKVRELLDRLSFLRAEDRPTDVLTLAGTLPGLLVPPQLPGTGLLLGALPARFNPRASREGTPLASVMLTVEEQQLRDDGSKEKKQRTVQLLVQGQDSLNRQVLIKVDDWPRQYVVQESTSDEKSLLDLLAQPALAYRGKLFDFNVGEVKQLTLQRKDQAISLAQNEGRWKLTQPTTTDADAKIAGQLAETLARLEPTRYVREGVKDTELATYGLDKPALAVRVQFREQTRTLQIGKEKEKGSYFARLEDNPSIFLISAELPEAINRDVLSLLPLELWRLQADEIQTVRVERLGEDPYTLERLAANRWKLGAPFNAEALVTAVRPLLEIVTSPNCDRYETLSTDDLKLYGLDKPYLRIEVSDSKQSKQQLVVGATVKDSRDRYARVGAQGPVCVLRGDVVQNLARPSLALVDTLLLSLPLDRVQRVEATQGNTTLILEGREGAWRVVQAPGAPFVADTNAINVLRETLFNLRAQRVVAYSATPDLTMYGLEKPFATVKLVEMRDGKTTERLIEIGADLKGQAGSRYARVDRGPAVAELTPVHTQALCRTHLGYVDHRLLTFDPTQVKSLRRSQGTTTLELVNNGGEWSLKTPQVMPAEETVLDALLRELASLRAAEIVDFPLTDPARYGLATPFAQLTLEVPGKPITLDLGKEVPGKPGARYCRVGAQPRAAFLNADVVQRLTAGPLAFRVREVNRFSDANKMMLERAQRQATFQRVGGTWTMTAPVKSKVDHEAMEDFLNRAARLRADEFVAEKPTDLKPYGLDRPAARWRFYDGEQVTLDLLIGNAEPKGRRRYAKLASGDLVFLLDLTLTQNVLGEYRERTVWTAPLDAAQIDSLRIVRGGKSLLLKRDGLGWIAEGQPAARLLPETVNDTLTTLTALKAERFAIDAGADFKLFGLDPPEGLIEVSVGERKMTLEFGRTEGDSKRLYARVVEPGRTEVLVLSDDDTMRLTRDLAAFGRPAPKKPGAHP